MRGWMLREYNALAKLVEVSMPRLPMPVTDELKLADWLELYALTSPDGNASFADLERALRREGIFGPDDNEDIERSILDVA